MLDQFLKVRFSAYKSNHIHWQVALFYNVDKSSVFFSIILFMAQYYIIFKYKINKFILYQIKNKKLFEIS